MTCFPNLTLSWVQNSSEALSAKPDFLLRIIFRFSFYLFREKTTWVAEAGFLGLICGGFYSWFLYYPHVRADVQRYERSLFFFSPQVWSPASLWGDTSPLCSCSSCVWGAVDDSHLLEWSLYRQAFNALPVFPRAIIETPLSSQLWSTALPGAAMLHFNQSHVSGPLLLFPPSMLGHHDNNGGCSQLPGCQVTGQTQASDGPAFRGITAELKERTERRNESARPVIVTSRASQTSQKPRSAS